VGRVGGGRQMKYQQQKVKEGRGRNGVCLKGTATSHREKGPKRRRGDRGAGKKGIRDGV